MPLRDQASRLVQKLEREETQTVRYARNPAIKPPISIRLCPSSSPT